MTVGVALVLWTGGCGGGGGDAATDRCPAGATSTTAAGAYTGVLLDAQVRLGDAAMPAALACLMPAHEVERAVLVARMDPDDTFATESVYREAVAGHEADFLPFFRVEDPSRVRLEHVLNEVGLFFRGVWTADLGRLPDEVFALAAESDLFVAAPAVGPQVAAAHPGTKVLVAAPLPSDGLADLLRAHPNVFVVVESPRPSDYDRWFPVIQAAPDRVMWGSGADAAGDVAPESYARLVADTRAFIARLPNPMRKPFALANARRLLGVPTPPEPDA